MSTTATSASLPPNPTAAQEEFASFVAKNSAASSSRIHPEDRASEARENHYEDEEDEEDRFRNNQIEHAMRLPTLNHIAGGAAAAELHLPPSTFDSGRATGVKGVIADARSYEAARRAKWITRVRAARQSMFGNRNGHGHGHGNNNNNSNSITSGGAGDSSGESEADDSDAHDEEAFLAQWRESRRRELESEAALPAIRTRRTSPSVRIFGRLDEVDAMGYLDAIEKVGRETVVVVFVYDHECQVSATVEAAMRPLIGTFPTVHFVKVHYEDIEFDNAGVPAILAYRNQGDLFANLTGIIEMIPDEEDFGSDSLRRVFQRHNIL